MNDKITIAGFKAECKAAFDAGQLVVPLNSFNTTMKDLPWLEKLGNDWGDREVASITVDDAEKVMMFVNFGDKRRGEGTMSDSGASSVYHSLVRFFDWAIDMGIIIENPVKKIRSGLIPRVKKAKKDKERTKAIKFSIADGEKLINVLLQTQPTFSAVKATLFTYIAYRYRKTPNELLTMTWDKFEAAGFTERDTFLAALVANYRPALEKWLEANNVTNRKDLFFVKYMQNGDAEPLDSGFVGSWLKKKVFGANEDLPRVTINTLCGNKVPRIGVFDEVDAGGDFPILGAITFPPIGFGGGSGADSEAFLADRKLCEELFHSTFKGGNKNTDGEEV